MRIIENKNPEKVDTEGEQDIIKVQWTDEEVETLIEAWKKRVSFKKIAQQIGRTRKSVIIKACRLGLTSRPNWNDQHKAKARRNGRPRHCMSCGNMFFSEGIGNRICLQCKERQIWSDGGDYWGI